MVLACNHVSFPDFVFVQQALLGRRLVRFLCRHEIWDSPAGWAMERMQHVPVDRQAPAAAYLKARALLRVGELLLDDGAVVDELHNPTAEGVLDRLKSLDVAAGPEATWDALLYVVERTMTGPGAARLSIARGAAQGW